MEIVRIIVYSTKEVYNCLKNNAMAKLAKSHRETKTQFMPFRFELYLL